MAATYISICSHHHSLDDIHSIACGGVPSSCVFFFLLVHPDLKQKLISDHRLLSQFEYHEVTSDSNLFPMMQR